VDVDIDASSEELSVCELWEARWKHTVRRFHEEHVQHRLRDTGDDRYGSGQYLSRSHLYTQHQRGMPELHHVLLVPSSGVEQSGETTVRAATAQPRRSVSDFFTQELRITLEKGYIIIL
jgi:hypothetical protein